jgi:hypothetical protein
MSLYLVAEYRLVHDEFGKIKMELMHHEYFTSDKLEFDDIEIQKELLFISYLSDIVGIVQDMNPESLECAVIRDVIETPLFMYPCLHIFDSSIEEENLGTCPLCRTNIIYMSTADHSITGKQRFRPEVKLKRNIAYLEKCKF